MFASDETVGLAEWIIDDTCLVFNNFIISKLDLVTWSSPMQLITASNTPLVSAIWLVRSQDTS